LRDPLYFPVFSANTRNPPRAAARAARATKNPARHAAQTPGVVSMNIFFWKILVTRVKRKIEMPFSPGNKPLTGQGYLGLRIVFLSQILR